MVESQVVKLGVKLGVKLRVKKKSITLEVKHGNARTKPRESSLRNTDAHNQRKVVAGRERTERVAQQETLLGKNRASGATNTTRHQHKEIGEGDTHSRGPDTHVYYI